MSNLGDALPFEQRKNLADLNFKIGSVFKFHDVVSNKEKRLVLIGIKYDKVIIAFLRINSELNENMFPTEKLKSEHLKLEFDPEIRPFLTHSSYVNCSFFFEQKFAAIYEMLIKKPSIHIGVLCEEDLKNIKAKVSSSRLLSPSQKKDFGLFFKPLK